MYSKLQDGLVAFYIGARLLCRLRQRQIPHGDAKTSLLSRLRTRYGIMILLMSLC